MTCNHCDDTGRVQHPTRGSVPCAYCEAGARVAVRAWQQARVGWRARPAPASCEDYTSVLERQQEPKAQSSPLTMCDADADGPTIVRRLLRVAQDLRWAESEVAEARADLEEGLKEYRRAVAELNALKHEAECLRTAASVLERGREGGEEAAGG